MLTRPAKRVRQLARFNSRDQPRRVTLTRRLEETKRMQRQRQVQEILNCLRRLIFPHIWRKPTATEENVVVILERQPKVNEIEKASKRKVVKYKTRETGSVDQAVTMLFPTGIVCIPNTMLFIRFQVSSRNSVS